MTPEVSLNRLAPLTPNAWLRYDVIQRLMPAGVTDVLEIGCGQGALGARLSAQYRYVGLEPDPESFAVAEGRFARLDGGQVRNVPLATLGAEDQFDLVCAFEVLEHIEDDEKALLEWTEHLRPGGWLLLSVPAHQHRYAAWDEAVGHFRRYDPDKLAELARKIGLEDVKVREYGAPLGYMLEFGRNAVANRKLKNMSEASMAERTGASGRTFQLANPAVSALAHYGTAPFRFLQRSFPHGTGVVLCAQKPQQP
jgi:SAM-dependent methyltransferase